MPLLGQSPSYLHCRTNVAIFAILLVSCGRSRRSLAGSRHPNGEGVRTGVRTYTAMGSNVLSNDPKDWSECGEGKEGGFHYFKVSVKMP